MRADGMRVVEALYGLLYPRRCPVYGFARHCAVRRHEYAAELERLGRPRDGRGRARRGRLLRLTGRRREAVAELRRAVALSPDLPEARAWLWESLLGPGGGADPGGGIDRAIALEPRNAWWRAWRAIGRLSSRRAGKAALADAEADCAEALGLDPACGLAALVLVAVAHRRGDDAAELRALDRAIRLEPRVYFLRVQRARLRLAAGDHEGFWEDHDAGTMLEERACWFTATVGGVNYAVGAPKPGVSTLCNVADAPPSVARRAGAEWVEELHKPGTLGSLRGLAAACDRALARDPRAWWMLALRGNCRRQPAINDRAGALADFEAAVELAPRSAWAWAYLSRMHMSTASRDAALRAADRSVELAPDAGWPRIWRGEVKRWFGDLEGSLADFDAGLALSPGYDFGRAWRGGARRALGKNARALEDLEIATELEPGYAWALSERSLALRGLGRWAEAAEILDAAHALDSRFVWSKEGSPEDLAELDAAVAAAPRDARLRAWRGDARSRAGDREGAASDLDRALALDPRRAHALVLRGARRDLDRAVKVAPRYAPAYLRRGVLLLETGKTARALSDLDRAAELEPQRTEIFARRAEAHAALKRWDAAAADLERVLEADGSEAAGKLKSMLARAR